MSGHDEMDEDQEVLEVLPVVLEEMEVDAVAVAPLVELVRLFSEAIDGRVLAAEDLIVSRGQDGRARVLVPDYLELTARDVVSLAVGEQPGAMAAKETATYLRELSELLGDLWGAADTLELPALEQLLADRGLPLVRSEPEPGPALEPDIETA